MIRAGRLARRGVAWTCIAAALGAPGCIEWLEVDDPDASVGGRVDVEPLLPARLPTRLAVADSPGPVVPLSPGRRVPPGYWSRVRLDAADMLLPYTWIRLDDAGGRMFLRLFASDRPLPSGQPPLPVLRGALALTVPEGTRVEELVGVPLGEDSIAGGTVAVRTTPRDNWLIEVQHLTLDEITASTVKGTLEGVARRGARSQTSRRVEIGFLALRSEPDVDDTGPIPTLTP